MLYKSTGIWKHYKPIKANQNLISERMEYVFIHFPKIYRLQVQNEDLYYGYYGNYINHNFFQNWITADSRSYIKTHYVFTAARYYKLERLKIAFSDWFGYNNTKKFNVHIQGVQNLTVVLEIGILNSFK